MGAKPRKQPVNRDALTALTDEYLELEKELGAMAWIRSSTRRATVLWRMHEIRLAIIDLTYRPWTIVVNEARKTNSK